MEIFIIIFHIIACVTLILVVLLQGGNEAGLSGAFGGGSSTESLFGAKSNTFLTRFTSSMAIIFMISSLWLAISSSKKHKSIVLKKEQAPIQAVVDKTTTPSKEKLTETIEKLEAAKKAADKKTAEAGL